MALFALTGVVLDGTGTTAAPTRQDITFPQGIDTTFAITITGQGGAPFNLTGYTGVMTLRYAEYTPSQAATLTLPMTIVSATAGTATCTFSAVTAKALNQSMFTYDLFITSGAGLRDEVIPNSLITLNAAAGM